MNGFYIINILFLLLTITSTYPVAENDEQDSDIEPIHENYRPRHNMNNYPAKSGHKKHRKRSAFSGHCAIMYKNAEPIGILQPFGENYRLLPVDGQKIDVEITPVTKRKKSVPNDQIDIMMAEREDSSDQRYPYIFAKFKIDSRMEKNVPDYSGRKQRAAKSPPLFDDDKMNSFQRALAKVKRDQGNAESEIRNVLNDMGLMEAGDTGMDKRDVRLESKRTTKKEEEAKQTTTQTTAKVDTSRKNDTKQEKKQSNFAIDSIDLLADEDGESSEREKREELEAKLEQEIKAKLEKIKDEVKREIDEMKSGRRKEEQETIALRKKRFAVETLADEETSDIDPVLNVDEKLTPYRRRRRSLDDLWEEYPPNVGQSDDYQNHEKPPNSRVVLRNLKEVDDAALNTKNQVEKEDWRACENTGKIDYKCDTQDQSKTHLEDYENFYDTDDDHSQLDSDDSTSYDDNEVDPQQAMVLEDGKYHLDLYPDIYRVKSDSVDETVKEGVQKRSALDGLFGIEIGKPVLRHLIAVRERSMLPNRRSRRMATDARLRLVDMRDEDLFGPVRQSFDNDRIRYKRVKRVDEDR